LCKVFRSLHRGVQFSYVIVFAIKLAEANLQTMYYDFD
jgi:hypothetical protein